MLKIIDLNFVAIFISTTVGIVVGVIWYSPLLFWKVLINDIRRSHIEGNKFLFPVLFSIFGMFILAVILDTFLFFSRLAGMNPFEAALLLGFTISVGVIALNMLSDYLISGTHIKFFIVHAGYRIVMTLLMSLTLALWR